MNKEKEVKVVEPTCPGESAVKCCHCRYYIRPVCNKQGKFTKRKATCAAGQVK